MKRCPHCGKENIGLYENLGRCSGCSADLATEDEKIANDLIGLVVETGISLAVNSLFDSDGSSTSDWTGGGGDSGGGGASGDW